MESGEAAKAAPPSVYHHLTVALFEAHELREKKMSERAAFAIARTGVDGKASIYTSQ